MSDDPARARYEGGSPMILHVMELDKFIPPFIEFVRDNFPDFDRHVFFCWGDTMRYAPPPLPNVLIVPDLAEAGAMLAFHRHLYAAEKVLLHGLFSTRVVKLLAMQPWLLPKCYWIIWGGDLYAYKQQTRTRRSRFDEALRRGVIRRMGHLVTWLDGDVELAREWYRATGKHLPCLMYTSNLYRHPDHLPARADGPLRIQIGNSADPSNEHFELLEILRPYADRDIQIIAPLSYGDRQHAMRVAERGRACFGDKFVALVDFVPLTRYLELLTSIDIAMFNHRRQQAMGNTINLLGLGKKVYLRSDVTPWSFFQRLGVSVFDVATFDGTRLSADEAARNSAIVRREFSASVLKGQLSRLFQHANGSAGRGCTPVGKPHETNAPSPGTERSQRT